MGHLDNGLVREDFMTARVSVHVQSYAMVFVSSHGIVSLSMGIMDSIGLRHCDPMATTESVRRCPGDESQPPYPAVLPWCKDVPSDVVLEIEAAQN